LNRREDRLPLACRLAMGVVWGQRKHVLRRLASRLHLVFCAQCRSEKVAWEGLGPFLGMCEYGRPSERVRSIVLGTARRHAPLPVRKPGGALRLALAGPAVVALAFFVCVLVKRRSQAHWNGSFSRDLARVRYRVEALRRSMSETSSPWDADVAALEERVEGLESSVQAHTWGKEKRP
jgi:hypothetical protein